MKTLFFVQQFHIVKNQTKIKKEKVEYDLKPCTVNFFDQTSLGLQLGKLFLARESLVSDIPAGDMNIAKLYLQCGEKTSVLPPCLEVEKLSSMMRKLLSDVM